jgi:ComF family protein
MTMTVKGLVEKTKATGRFAIEGINHLLWPAVCDCCGASILESDNRLCRECWNELLQAAAGDYCPGCGRDASKYGIIDGRCANCQSAKIRFDGIARAGVYDGTLRDLILGFKFHDRTELAGLLCKLADSAWQGSIYRSQTDLIVPVPLHWRRRIVRGYNQSLIIARGLKLSSARINTDLVRVRHTKRQWNLTPPKRRKNVAGAFAVRKGHNFSGRNVCLVDDITTSHATLNECARTLKEAGAEKVFACVIAVAMQDTN